MKISDLKSYFLEFSTTKKIAIGASVGLLIALLITGIILLVYFLVKRSRKNSDIKKVDVNTSTDANSRAKSDEIAHWRSEGRSDFMNNKSKRTLDNLDIQAAYNSGWDEMSDLWNINKTILENQHKMSGMVDMLDGLPDRSSDLFVKYQIPYKEGYTMSDENIISDALAGKLNGYNYYNSGGFAISVGAILKNEYSRGNPSNNEPRNFVNVGPFDEYGYFKKSLMSAKMREIAETIYNMGVRDYYASDEYKNKMIADYTKMGYSDAGNELPKKELEEEYQIAYNKGWDEFMDNWITNRAKIEKEQKLVGIYFSIMGQGSDISPPILYQKSYFEGYYMSNEDILKEALLGNLNELSTGYVNVGGYLYPERSVGDILSRSYSYGKREGEQLLIDPSYRLSGANIGLTYPAKLQTLTQMAYDLGLSESSTTQN